VVKSWLFFSFLELRGSKGVLVSGFIWHGIGVSSHDDIILVGGYLIDSI